MTITEPVRCPDLPASYVEQPQPVRAYAFAPHPGVVALPAPTFVLGGRFVGRDHDDQVGIGQREVTRHPTGPGRDRLHDPVDQPDPV